MRIIEILLPEWKGCLRLYHKRVVLGQSAGHGVLCFIFRVLCAFEMVDVMQRATPSQQRLEEAT